MIQLLEQEVSGGSVISFCDLSVREQECDEWEFLHYPSLSIAERSHYALARAGRMIHDIMSSTTLSSNNHLQQEKDKFVVLIVDDEEHRNHLLKNDGTSGEFLVVSTEEFLNFALTQKLFSVDESRGDKGSNEREKLEELRELCEEDYRQRNQPPNVTLGPDKEGRGVQQYLTEEEIAKGLKNGELVRGRLEVTKENPKEAFVTVHHGDSLCRYFVNQRLERHFNRALHGDLVILKPLPEAEWGRPIGRRRLVHNAENNDGDESSSFSNTRDNDVPAAPSARVVAIAAPSSRLRYVATLVDVPLHDESAVLLVPMDVRIPKIRVTTKSWRKFINQRLLVEIDGWEIGSTYPHGRCVEILGPIGDLEVEIRCLLIENEIILDPFSTAAMACLPPQGASWTVPDEEIQKRRDLRRSHRIFSVDPPGCQDIDDTMHAKKLPNGDIEVGVHIADVVYFVPHNSPLDKEAQKRGTTFYLVDRRFDMLPSVLSSNLCSLHGDVDRLAVSVIWTLSSDMETVKSVWYGRTVIHNCQAMTYDQAHNILHDKPPDEQGKSAPPPLTAGYPVDPGRIKELKEGLIILRDLARKLKKHREDVGGAVDLSSGDLGGELKFILDENGNPTEVKPKKELEIHNTIAEMMILANGYVATKIFATFPESALLRIHRTVEQSRFSDLKDVLDVGGVSLDGSSNMALANTLKKVEKAGAVVNSLIKSLATR
jgi:DIS3-like exonuclease 1